MSGAAIIARIEFTMIFQAFESSLQGMFKRSMLGSGNELVNII